MQSFHQISVCRIWNTSLLLEMAQWLAYLYYGYLDYRKI